jgi:hypothetical protein
MQTPSISLPGPHAPSPRRRGSFLRRPSAASRLAILFNLIYLVGISDLTSLSIGGGNVRWAWASLPLLALLVPGRRGDTPLLRASLGLFAVHVVAAFAAGAVGRGLVYSVWILVNYYFFFRAAYLITRALGDRVWDAILWGGRVQIACGVLLTLAGIDERARFVYFEPSYLAIGLVPYLFTVVIRSHRRLLDYGLLLSLLVANQSANMLLAMATALVFWLACTRRLLVLLGLAIAIPAAAYGGYRHALNDPADPNHGVAAWLSENPINVEIAAVLLTRAGNRAPRVEAALEVVGDRWLFGLGPGNYNDITSSMNFDHLTGGLEYQDPAGMPVINVLLEAVSNAGLPAAAILLLVYLAVARDALQIRNNEERWIVLGSLTAIGLMLLVESSYLRAYVWFAFGVFVARSRASRPRRSFFPTPVHVSTDSLF